MKLIAQLLDSRISTLFPRWNSIVNPAPYRSGNATLRPCFSYKWVKCPICAIGVSQATTKLHRESSVERLLRIQLSDDSCSCFSGHKVHPSVYTYCGSLDRPDGSLTQALRGVQAVLSEMSITPSQMGAFTGGFCRPVDMGDEHDTIPESARLLSECSVVRGFQRRKNSLSLELGEWGSGCQTILAIIKRLHDNYSFLSIHRLFVDKKKRSFLITVKGSGSRYCMYRDGVHRTNRIYFSLDLKRARIKVHCLVPDCKRDHDKPLVERALTLVEKYQITAQFGLLDTRKRPEISRITPGTGEKVVQSMYTYDKQQPAETKDHQL